MKILILPPYQNKNGYTQKQTIELMAALEEKGQITKAEYVIDNGFFIEWLEERRDCEFLATISLGIIRKTREHAAAGKVDAIVSMGSMEPGFYPAREISAIPFMGALHSALHMASLIGDKCSVIEATDPQAILVRRHAKMYGFDHKLASARHAGFSSTEMGKMLAEHPRGKRATVPAIKAVIDKIVAQCRAAVDQDGADCVILSCMPLQVLEPEIRREFDSLGYREIPLIGELSASVAMAQAVISMRLSTARVANPRADTQIKPGYR